MSQEGSPKANLHENDEVPASRQGEQPPSPTATNTATGQESQRPSSENHTPAVAERNQVSSSISSEHSNDTVNGEHESNDRQGMESSSEEHMGSSKEPLADYGWEELEQRFTARMEECRKNEELLGQEFNEWLKIFRAWASITEVHEEERASKRLRTRIAYVQDRESELETRRQHYVKVVNAFESALALFTD